MHELSMKPLNEYLLSKNKKHIEKELLDKRYTNVDDLVDDLNEYFGDNLKKPIKVVKSNVVFKPIGEYTKDGIWVEDHFMIEFNNISTRIRFGYHRSYGLMSQVIYLTWKGKNDYGDLYRNGYQFGKDNFLEWIKSHPNKRTRELFNIESASI